MRWKLPVLLVAGVLAAGGAYTGLKGRARSAEPAPPTPAVPVQASAASSGDVAVYLRGIGTVQALNSVEIHPEVGGILLSVPVKEGQEVKKGDVVAVIDPRPFKAELDKAQAARTQDQVQLDNAKADLQRYSTLARSDFASRQTLDTQQALVNKLMGAIEADNAAIETAQINLDYAAVHAPLDGRVSLRRVDPGNLIQANATGPGILSIVQHRPIAVLFTLPESEVNTVRDAMAKGTLPVIADSSDGKTTLARGTLLTADNAVNTGTGTMQYKAVFENADDRLTPGQFVSTRLQVGTEHGVTVPHLAIQHNQEGLFIYVVGAGSTIERRAVTLAYDDGQTAVVKTGVKDGEMVVTTGQSRIGQGIKVSVTGKATADAAGTAP